MSSINRPMVRTRGRRSDGDSGVPVRGLRGGSHRGQVWLDVALPIQGGQRGQRRVVLSEESGEVPEPAGDTEHGRTRAGA